MNVITYSAAYWVAWVDGWRARMPNDLAGYKNEGEVAAVASIDALLAAAEIQIMRAGRNASPESQRIGEAALEGLRELQRCEPGIFASHAAHVLGLAMPPVIDYEAYATWRRRKEDSNG